VKSKGTNGDAEQKSFLHSSQQVTGDEAKEKPAVFWCGPARRKLLHLLIIQGR